MDIQSAPTSDRNADALGNAAQSSKSLPILATTRGLRTPVCDRTWEQTLLSGQITRGLVVSMRARSSIANASAEASGLSRTNAAATSPRWILTAERSEAALARNKWHGARPALQAQHAELDGIGLQRILETKASPVL